MLDEFINQIDELLNPVTSSAQACSFDAILNETKSDLSIQLKNQQKALKLINCSEYQNENPVQLRRLLIDARIRRNDCKHKSELYDHPDSGFIIQLLEDDTSDFVLMFIQEAFSHEDIPNKNIIPICDVLIPTFLDIQDELRIIKCKALSCEYKNIDAMKLYEYLEMKLGHDDLRVVELSGFIGL
jgi:hypothetical protein